MFPIEYEVFTEGREPVEHNLEDVCVVESIDVFVKELQKRYGMYCTIKIHVWRANWSA